MVDHTLKVFENDLEGLDQRIADLGRCAVDELDGALKALVHSDCAAARAVIESDAHADALTRQIQHEVLRITARWQPVASDLRKILASERIGANLERAADHAKNIAKRSLALDEPISEQQAVMLERLAAIARRQLKQVLEAWATKDVKLAQVVWLSDTEADGLHDDLFHHILADIREGRGPTINGVHLLFIAKSLERIGDHATNIAEEVRFMVAGITVSEPRPHA
ncbi:MAG: phosphate transport system regulatory protein PhoU [Candidatus Competibacteraceae bacterium]|jgi:phosphate transport system protein|nr:MAG: phosphate transport system regulatory protein PhoU [Candidatus Competibacteraceae bacterium]